jgi:hypothetical protein
MADAIIGTFAGDFRKVLCDVTCALLCADGAQADDGVRRGRLASVP